MSELYFLDLEIVLKRPMTVTNQDGQGLMEDLRKFSVSLPIRDKERAEQMMDHLAKGFADVFKEVEAHVNVERKAIEAGSRNDGGEARPGDELQITVAPTAEIAGPIGAGGRAVGGHISPCADGESRTDNTREEA